MRDYRSLEHKIRLIKEGRLSSDGWEKINETTWYHPVAEIARVIDEEGNEQILNKAGERVTILPTKTLHQKLQIQSKIIDEAFPKKDDDKKKEDKDPANDKGLEGKDKKSKTPGKNTDLETSDRKDPKEIKGGKTEVDTEPTTNEKLPSPESDAKKSKKKEVKEQSAATLKDYVNKADIYRDKKYTGLALKKIAAKKKTEKAAVKEENLDELSFETHKAYLDKAHNDPQRRQGVHMAAYKRMKHIVHTEPATTKRGKETQERQLKNQHARATSTPMKKPGTTHANEEVIDEAGVERLMAYRTRARYDRDKMKKSSQVDAYHPIIRNREKGIKLANKKLIGGAKVNAEGFTPEELAHFDRIMAEEYVDMNKKNVDAIINAKGKPHKVYTATDETRHGISVDELKRHLGVSADSDGVHKKFMHNLHTAGIRTGWSHSSGKWIVYHGPKV